MLFRPQNKELEEKITINYVSIVTLCCSILLQTIWIFSYGSYLIEQPNSEDPLETLVCLAISNKLGAPSNLFRGEHFL